ncbi:MAG: hypothetical protein MRERV_37c005 [Mycoplasmataceae bacterium RV_VA103A]|nr:MAG: hypothetical protein MRERV_37c005 [Mycoplasmataceae bacterium RV_VA103A]
MEKKYSLLSAEEKKLVANPLKNNSVKGGYFGLKLLIFNKYLGEGNVFSLLSRFRITDLLWNNDEILKNFKEYIYK